MPATQLTVNKLANNGLTSGADTYVATDPVNGNYCINNGRLILAFENTDAGPQTVTLDDEPDERGRTLQTAEKTITLAAGEKRTFGVFASNLWNKKSGDEAGGVVFTASDAAVLVFPHEAGQ